MDARDVLKNIYLFRDASPDELAAVAAIAEPKAYMVEENVYYAGDPSEALFIIESGTVDIRIKDKDVILGSVGGGQVLGEMAFFERGERLASAVTREPTHVLRLPFTKLDAVFREHPNLASGFYRQACVLLSRHLRMLAPDLNRRYL